MANILSHDRKLMTLRLLVEGNSLRSITRITGNHRSAVSRVLLDFGTRAQEFLDRTLRGLTFRHIEIDEVWTYVAKKQGRLEVLERDNPLIGDMYLWTAFDADTKLVASHIVGKRSADMARRLMVDLAGRLVMPGVNEPYRPVTQISTDGFAAYPEAVDLAFGPYVRYGQCIKNFRNSDQPGRYGPPEMTETIKRPVFGNLHPDEISTSLVERNNLTIRTFMKRFTRLALGFSKKLEYLAAAVATHVAYFNFVWRPRTLRVTPAMKAKVTNQLWSLEDLYNEVMR